MDDYPSRLHQSYVKERETLNASSLEVGKRYDQIVLTLAGGSLALSLTFLERIAPNPLPGTILILIPAWASLVISVGSQLFALRASEHSLEWQITYLDELYGSYFASADVEDAVRESQGKPQKENPFVPRSKKYNRISVWFLAVGIVLLIAFSATNMYFRKEAGNGGREKQEANRESPKGLQGDIYPSKATGSSSAPSQKE